MLTRKIQQFGRQGMLFLSTDGWNTLHSKYFNRCWVYAVTLNLLKSCCSSTRIKIKQVASSLTKMYRTLNMLSEIQILPSDSGFCNLLFPLIHYSNTVWWWGELGFINHQELGSIHIQTRLLFPCIHLDSMCEFFVYLTWKFPHFYLAFSKKGRRDRKIKIQPSQGKEKKKWQVKVAHQRICVVPQAGLMLSLAVHFRVS